MCNVCVVVSYQWQTVHLRGLRVTDWNKAAVHFSKVGTRYLVSIIPASSLCSDCLRDFA